MTLPLAVRALFGRREPESERPAAPPAPSEHPSRRLLAALDAPDFATLQELAEQRQAVGLPAGAVDVVFNAYGQPAGMRPRRYRSAIEGEVDRRIQDMADRLQTERDAAERESLAGRLDVAKRYQALAGLWDLENRLAALPAAPKPQGAPAAPQRPSAAVSSEPASQAPAVGYDANIRALNAQRADVLRDRRAFEVARFEARQESQARALAVPSADEDVDALRVRLEARLVEWTAANPALVEELTRFG